MKTVESIVYHILLGFGGVRATRADSVSLHPTSITGIE